uniref:Lysozyme n=1 Tax=Antheraea mylitta TaxID=34739 RepID=LYS_ANTMY|nr:RecName: Full=Lysozyme; AltName: Full=1,4-beta-N-acetylmuramidase [Antheraea mylitta]1IIZ_A Chain A, LYSOZYME [Antheraea mylitta]
KRFTRCGLVNELRKQGFDENLMRDWVCLVENESARYTDKIANVNKNGSRDYGLFQINDKYWCSKGSTPGKDCNVTCSQLLTDDITVASTCAKKIYKRTKFDAWSGWDNHCNHSNPDISSC